MATLWIVFGPHAKQSQCEESQVDQNGIAERKCKATGNERDKAVQDPTWNETSRTKIQNAELCYCCNQKQWHQWQNDNHHINNNNYRIILQHHIPRVFHEIESFHLSPLNTSFCVQNSCIREAAQMSKLRVCFKTLSVRNREFLCRFKTKLSWLKNTCQKLHVVEWGVRPNLMSLCPVSTTLDGLPIFLPPYISGHNHGRVDDDKSHEFQFSWVGVLGRQFHQGRPSEALALAASCFSTLTFTKPARTCRQTTWLFSKQHISRIGRLLQLQSGAPEAFSICAAETGSKLLWPRSHRKRFSRLPNQTMKDAGERVYRYLPLQKQSENPSIQVNFGLSRQINTWEINMPFWWNFDSTRNSDCPHTDWDPPALKLGAKRTAFFQNQDLINTVSALNAPRTLPRAQSTFRLLGQKLPWPQPWIYSCETQSGRVPFHCNATQFADRQTPETKLQKYQSDQKFIFDLFSCRNVKEHGEICLWSRGFWYQIKKTTFLTWWHDSYFRFLFQVFVRWNSLSRDRISSRLPWTA